LIYIHKNRLHREMCYRYTIRVRPALGFEPRPSAYRQIRVCLL